jgi:hypothetical protein
MMLRELTTAVGLSFAACLLACSSTSNSGAPADAGPPDVGVQDTGKAPPVVDSSFPVPDGPFMQDLPDSPQSMCEMLLATVGSLQPAAQACDPNGTAQCHVAAKGTCCSITVDESTSQDAINAFETAVMAYVTACDPKCNLVTCPAVPSGLCSGGGNIGTCQ